MVSARTKLIAISLKYNGDWKKIFEDVTLRRDVEDEYVEKAEQLKCGTLTMVDDEYPEHLKHTYQPPIVLYYYGDISLIKDFHNNISVVGSRDCSQYGADATRKIVKGLVENNHTIVSGLAIGIDAIAHETAINNGGRTIAVLASGIDYCYPLVNLPLYKEIKENHLLLSEKPGNLAPTQFSFPFRNRIIANISQTLVVTEAYASSGTLLTVLHALQGNTDVMCVPYPIGSESECNRLIMSGACLVESAEDVENQIASF